MTELERILGPTLAREFAWAAVCAMGRAALFLVAGACVVVSLLACAGEYFWFLIVIGCGIAAAVVAWREGPGP